MKKIYGIFSLAIVVLLTSAAAFSQELSMPQMRITYEGKLDDSKQEYTPGTLWLQDTDGTVWDIPNAQFRKRGATALNYSMKPSLNIKLKDEKGDELDTELLGIRKASSFILDAMAIDRINMRNRVAFDIWNDFSSLPYETEFDSRNGSKGVFVEMYINGEYKGIYCLSDKVNRKLLDLKKPQVDEETGEVTIRGVLYKHGTTDDGCDQNTPGFYNNYIDWVAKSKDVWELHEPEEYAGEAAWTPMTELYADDNYKNYEYVKNHFWLENLADYTIHVMALSIGDNWGNKNKYFSIKNITKVGEDNSRFVVTPWDLDTSLGGNYDGSKYDGNYTNWTPKDITKNAPLPFSCCLSQQEFKDLLKQRWIEGSLGAFSIESVSQRLRDNCRLFMESGAWGRTVEYWPTQKYAEKYVEDLEKEVELVIKWYEARFASMDEYFGITPEERAGFAGVEFTITDSETGTDAIYNIQGLKVEDMTAPGLYIVGGKKILVK